MGCHIRQSVEVTFVLLAYPYNVCSNSIYASIYGVSTNETFLDVAKIQVSQGQAECLNPTVSTIVTGGGFVVVWEAVVSVSDTRLPKQRRVRFRLFGMLRIADFILTL